MVEFTKAQLNRLANMSGQEFAIRKVVNGNGEETDQVLRKGRWFGGRIARHHKIEKGEEDRTVKQQEYGRAKVAVLDSLKKIYGDEIAEKAFRSHIGKTVDGEFDTSFDHPITSRHIRQMLKTAEKELREQIILQEFNKDFRDFDGKVMSERATAAWMKSKSVGWTGPNGQPAPFDNSEENRSLLRTYELSNSDQERHDGRIPIGSIHYKLRGDRVTDERIRLTEDEPKGTPVARLLLGHNGPPRIKGDVNRFLDGDPRQKDGFWTLELDLEKSVGGRKNHLIGIHVDRDDDEFINVFDANRCEARIPRSHFEDWLNKHLQGYDGISSLTLHRTEETLLGSFEKRDGVWHWDERIELKPHEVQVLTDDFMPKFQECTQSGTKDDKGLVYNQSLKDIDRFKFTVEGDGYPIKLTSPNVEQELLKLVRDEPDNEEPDNDSVVDGDGDVNLSEVNFFVEDPPKPEISDQDKHASKALSCFLNQDLLTSLDGVTKERLPLDRLDNYIIPAGAFYKDDLGAEISRDGDTIYIRYYKERDLIEFSDGETLRHLSPQTDYFDFEATIAVNIDELRRAGAKDEVPKFEFVKPPKGRLHIESSCEPSELPVPGSVPLMTTNEALQRPSLLTDDDWAKQERSFRKRISEQHVVLFGTGEDDAPVPFSFDAFVRSHTLQVRVDGEARTLTSLHPIEGQLGAPESSEQPYLAFSDVTGGENEAMELAKLIDRELIMQFAREALMMNGLSYNQARHVMVSDFRVDLTRIDEDGQESVEIKLSTAIDPDDDQHEAFHKLPGDEREYWVSMTLRVTLEDLRNGTPENFTVVRRPFLEAFGPPVEGLDPPAVEGPDVLQDQDENVGDGNVGNQNNDNVPNENIVEVNQNVGNENVVDVNPNEVKENV